MKRRSKIVNGFFVFFILTFSAQQIFACGPFSTVYIYNAEDINRYYPVVSGESFFEPKPTLLLDRWGAEYAYPYYRSLIGRELSTETKGQLEKLYAGTYFSQSAATPLREATEQWQEARSSVMQTSTSIDTSYCSSWHCYNNCLADAFVTASQTLEDRKNNYSEQELREWVETQDQVFAECGSKRTYSQTQKHDSVFEASIANSLGSVLSFPGKIVESIGGFFGRTAQSIANFFSKNAPEPQENEEFTREGTLLEYDHQYQEAAKAFYQWDFPKAERMFSQIAENEQQPWRAEAHLVLGRLYIRQAHEADDERGYSMQKAGNASGQKRAYFEKAKNQFQAILNDESLTEIHEGTQSLLNYVNFRIDPETRMQDAEQTLSASSNPNKIVENLEDLAWLWYHGIIDETLAFERGGDFVQWYYTWQNPKEQYLDRALQKYDETQSLAWLLASLKAMPSGHVREQELMTAASAIPQKSSAYVTGQYYSLKLALQKTNNEQAKQAVESMLAAMDAQGNSIAYNHFADLRMIFSDQLEEALSFSDRKIVGVERYDGWAPELSAEVKNRPLIDKKARRLLNELLPLETWVDVASQNDIFPARTAEQIRLVAFVRAILLEDFQSAQTMAQLLSQNSQSLAADLNDFLHTTQTERKKFAAIFFMLKRPHLETILDSHIDTTNLGDVNTSSYHREWWCSFDPEENNPYKGSYLGSRSYNIGRLNHLVSPQQKSQAALELETVGNTTAANYLVQETLHYARQYPTDHRVPEALHLAVFATRSPCGKNQQTTTLSEQAFKLLHQRYPNSAWAQATPYWY